MTHRHLPIIIVAALAAGAGALYVPDAVAQTTRSGGGGNAQLMQQMQQLASERTSLQAENARMKKELAEVTKERDALKSGKTALEQRARAGEASIARNAQDKQAAESEVGKLKDRMQELITQVPRDGAPRSRTWKPSVRHLQAVAGRARCRAAPVHRAERGAVQAEW